MARKIAGVTYDQWLTKPGKRPGRVREVKKYSNKIIAFIDVLGIKALIEEYRKHDEYKAIDKIEQIRKIVDDSTRIVKQTTQNADLEYLQISDSFVFVCDPQTVISLIELLSTIQMRIITECQFLLRGAITIGDAIVREFGKFIVGPAYIQAYQLQENDAIYPRIIVDKSVSRGIKKSGHAITDYLQRDSDREFFVDYIKVYMNKESLSRQKIKSTLRREDIFSYLQRRFNEHYEKENHNISQKFGWTIQYCKKLEVWENG
jgi:hypothetical protein